MVGLVIGAHRINVPGVYFLSVGGESSRESDNPSKKRPPKKDVDDRYGGNIAVVPARGVDRWQQVAPNDRRYEKKTHSAERRIPFLRVGSR